MKRFGSSDSLVPFLYPQESNMQMMMDGLEDEESMEEIGHGSVKKRRLAVEQVQSLEKIFEVDNKLDPERKIKLAQELGLQPRQVAIWFQNRRARWKTKQLERDYNHLKANYENLQHSFSAIEQEKQNLVTELNGLKEKLQGKKGSDQEKCDSLMFPGISGKPQMATNSSAITEFPELKDGSSDESDNSSNGFLKVQNNPSPKILSDISCSETNPGMCLSSSMYYPQFLDSRPLPSAEAHHHYHHQAQPNQEDQLQQQHNAKMEVVSLFGVDESCNMFTVDQSQNSLYWYY